MDSTLTIREIRPTELDFATECTEREGWDSETRAEFEGFYAHDSSGCLIAERTGAPIGIAVATSYGAYGFVGEIIVNPEERGRGLGRILLDRAIEYLRGCGAESIYLDGVVAAVPLYERAGFKRICRSLRFVREAGEGGTAWVGAAGTGTTEAAKAGTAGDKRYAGVAGAADRSAVGDRSLVRAMRSSDLETVCALDCQAFGADRSFFLNRRLLLYPELCWVSVENGILTGFLMGRRGRSIVSAGPWLALAEVGSPRALIEALVVATEGTKVQVGVLETNPKAVEVIRSLGFGERPSPPWRMVLGPSERLGSSDQIYAIGSAAKG
jgi:ribosomal protein S18 acetylase RimI-like enzyme